MTKQKIKVKICGLRRIEDILMVNETKPDYAGFILAESKRRVTAADIERMASLLLPSIQRVGVFVNAPINEVISLVRQGVIHIPQLHGDEDVAYCHVLEQEGIPYWKVVRVKGRGDMIDLHSLEKIIHPEAFLLDAYSESGRGGTGKVFHHPWLTAYRGKTKLIVGGGLTAENVASLVSTYKPFAVDTSSGVETDGVKDKEKIQAFIAALRGQRTGENNETE